MESLKAKFSQAVTWTKANVGLSVGIAVAVLGAIWYFMKGGRKLRV